MEKVLISVGLDGWRREVLHRRLIGEGAGLQKASRPKRLCYPVATGRKVLAGVEPLRVIGVCLHAIQKSDKRPPYD